MKRIICKGSKEKIVELLNDLLDEENYSMCQDETTDKYEEMYYDLLKKYRKLYAIYTKMYHFIDKKNDEVIEYLCHEDFYLDDTIEEGDEE